MQSHDLKGWRKCGWFLLLMGLLLEGEPIFSWVSKPELSAMQLIQAHPWAWIGGAICAGIGGRLAFSKDQSDFWNQ